jgi:hypothetical protein
MTTVEAVLEDLSAREARDLVSRISSALGRVWDDVKRAYMGRAWLALGYATWDELCRAEFGSTQIRLPREERQEVVASLAESGLSQPAIAAATGLGLGTVHRELTAAFPNGKPETTGTDGKSYSAARHPVDQVTADDLAELNGVTLDTESIQRSSGYPSVGRA